MHSEGINASGFTVNVAESDDATIVSVSGELDIATADRLTKALAGIVVEPNHRLVVDLSDVEFMDSTGLRLLIGANRKAGEAGYRFAVVTGGSPAKRVFELTKMDEHINVVDRLADAR
ncbi:MAG: STAS domain-containing protein [Solirubrobacterales bacterium]